LEGEATLQFGVVGRGAFFYGDNYVLWILREDRAYVIISLLTIHSRTDGQERNARPFTGLDHFREVAPRSHDTAVQMCDYVPAHCSGNFHAHPLGHLWLVQMVHDGAAHGTGPDYGCFTQFRHAS